MDWEYYEPYLEEHDPFLQEKLEHLRIYHPIIWIMITQRRRTLRSISDSLALPSPVTLLELRRYKSEGWVEDVQAETSVVWTLLDSDHVDLQAYCREVRERNAAPNHRDD